jgi:hypothetical protein
MGEFAMRLGGSLLLVLATWNPSGYSFARWIADAWSADALDAIHAFVGVLLLIGWVILIRATLNSLGRLGVMLGALLLGVTVWLLFDLGVLHDQSATLLGWIAMVGIATLLALGLSWSHLWRRLTGQVDTDDFDRD